MRLKEKTAVVTGASQGIGRATAELFAEEGARVIACDLREPEPYTSAGIEWRRFDVTEPEDWEALGAHLADDVGRLDVLVNNAGLVHTYADIAKVSLEDWDHVMSVNLNGTFLGIRSALPLMYEHGGSIVNLSSIWGNVGAEGAAAYQAAKGAVRTLTKNAAITYAKDGIRVNSIHPGLVVTPLVERSDPEMTRAVLAQTPLGRGGRPREIAYGALFLASDESSFMTGSELIMDGGFLAL